MSKYLNLALALFGITLISILIILVLFIDKPNYDEIIAKEQEKTLEKFDDLDSDFQKLKAYSFYRYELSTP